MKPIVSVTLIIIYLISTHVSVASSKTLMSFDFKDNQIENGFDDWYYSDKGSNPCSVYNGEEQSKLCNTAGFKFYPYYNSRNSDHMGWMRYGYIDVATDNAIKNTALMMRSTGGDYKDEDLTIQHDGSKIKAKSDFSGPSDLGSLNLAGDTSLHFKGPTATSAIPEFQGDVNRLTVWLLMPKGKVKFDEYSNTQRNAPQQRFAFYPFIDTSKAAHYYHHISNIPMGGWTKVQFDASPTHKNSGVNNALHALTEGGSEYSGDGKSYFNNMAAFSLRALFLKGMNADTYFVIDEIETAYKPYENEETIKSLSMGFDPESLRFDISLEDKYRCSTCNATYEVRYAFSPITNANYDQAFLPETIINFNRSMNNSEGKLYKPTTGYNLVWGALDLQEEHRTLLTEGQTVYFAVKDISERLADNQYDEDFEQVDVPGVGTRAKVELIKTIEYTIYPVMYSLEIVPENIDSPVVNYNFNSHVDVVGGTPPYSMQAYNLPTGISLSDDGTLEGVPSKVEQLESIISVTDATGIYSEKTIQLNTISEDDLKIPHCRVAVDFDSAGHELDTVSFDQVIQDRYTDAYKTGMTIIVGQNGLYNYQGITGSGLYLSEGDEIRAIWQNKTSDTYGFTPRISFTQNARYSNENSAHWYSMSRANIDESSTVTTTFTIADDQYIDLININANFNNNQGLLLDRIEIVSTQYNDTDTCLKPTSYTKVSSSLIVDFNASDEQSIFGNSELSTIIKDKYTDYVEDGVAIAAGKNAKYNYQGVSGNGISVPEGKKLMVYWKNYNEYPITFTPFVSFSDTNRKSDDEAWLELSNTHIQAYDNVLGTPGAAVSEITINSSLAGIINVINVNSNVTDYKGLVLDKIELVDKE